MGDKLRFFSSGIFFCLLLCLPVIAAGGELRTWTSKDSKTVEAEFVEVIGNTVVLKRCSGKRLKIVVSRLSKVDQDYIRKKQADLRKESIEKRAAVFKSRTRRKVAKAVGEKPDYLSEKEWGVIQAANEARQDPAKFAEYLVAYRKTYIGENMFKLKNANLVTHEGATAVDEAIEFLKKQSVCPVQKPSKGLSRAARDHAEDIGAADIVGHTGTDGSHPIDRIERHGKFREICGENIHFGEGDARNIIMQLIIDDGVLGRGHRTNIFNKKFKVCGVAIAPHKTYGLCCVIDYAGGFSN